MEFDLKEVEKLVLSDRLYGEYRADTKTLYIDSILNGNVVDNNFREIEARINHLENKLEDLNSQLKLRYIGELNRIKGEVEKLKF